MGTLLGLKAEKATSSGQLVSDEVVNAVVEKWLSLHSGAFVFDGYPRSLGQAAALDVMLAERQVSVGLTLLLEVDSQTVRERVQRRMMCSSCGMIVSIGRHVSSANASCPSCDGKLIKRLDDNPETLELRMLEYMDKTEPLIGYYRERSLLRRVDAAREPEIVFSSIVEILEGA